MTNLGTQYILQTYLDCRFGLDTNAKYEYVPIREEPNFENIRSFNPGNRSKGVSTTPNSNNKQTKYNIQSKPFVPKLKRDSTPKRQLNTNDKPKQTTSQLESTPSIPSYIATSVRNNTQLLNTDKLNNLTYTFTIQLPQHQTVNAPLLYYYFQSYSVFRVKYITFDEWKTSFLNKLSTINQLDKRQLIDQLKETCKYMFDDYTKLIPLKSIDEVNNYYNLYINLIRVMDIVVDSIEKLNSNNIKGSNTTELNSNDSQSKNKTVDITQLEQINEINNQPEDSTTENEPTEDLATECYDYLVTLLNNYESKPINNEVTLSEIINTFDKFNKRYVQLANILVGSSIDYKNKYNTILIPKEYFNYPDYIDYSINYPFMVNPDWAYWVDFKPVNYNPTMNTVDVGYKIKDICDSTKLNSNGLYYKAKDKLDSKESTKPKMLIALNFNHKNENINDENMNIPSDVVCFVLSQNEFNHLEPNVMPWIFA